MVRMCITYMIETRNAYKILVGKQLVKRPVGRHKHAKVFP
jgi:hypothetical protein